MSRLRPDLAESVLARLGFSSAPTPDLGGLSAVYRSWCDLVPFDNVRKLIALHRPDPPPLPGLDVDEFFRAWLDHGVGGTCWPSSYALWSLLHHCGFTVRPVASSMFDVGVASHGTNIVTIEGQEWLVDSSMLFGRPLRLDPSGPTSLDDPTFHTTAEPVAEGWLFHFPRGDGTELIPCRTITPDAVDLDLYRARYEWSRHNSPFNKGVHMGRNRRTAVLTYTTGIRLLRTGSEVETSSLSGEQLRDALVAEMGLSEAIVAELASVRVLS